MRILRGILTVLPQFVAVGPQSAGKSSVIRRVSGVALPEASTLCTRIATMVQMRRAKEPIIAVILQGPGAETLMEEVFDEAEAEGTKVKDAVKRAQDTALARSSCKPGSLSTIILSWSRSAGRRSPMSR